MYKLKVCVNDYIKSGIVAVDVTVNCSSNSCSCKGKSSVHVYVKKKKIIMLKCYIKKCM